ncbi:IS91 family transposase [Iocasia frigidifontis]|uniref:IS91 family transposase n=1 Tax=Iocasia fonsfrigidae TaxID=2682810 RepID=A0A8A7K5D9_9FIRM|nr:transposase [Iocasia fonsfrigidae]QTL96916.1 IS91 family transposase [Iocasia fonsfrigidae]QTL98281.1 IS91 family transposase [Iocasia fonsfrigidae]QTL99376.1 IS91 family transposase [Iocasia fonsfrigidae]
MDNLIELISIMKRKEIQKQHTIKKIFTHNNNWKIFKDNRLSEVVPADMIDDVIEQVERALGCGNPENGYTLYKCLECGHEHIIGFSCKSRFCVRCGKKYIDNWVEKQVENILDTSHRHLVFTLPEQLRGYVYWHRDLLKDMCDAVNELIQDYYDKQSKEKEYQVGVITVVHTFGRDVGFNPHIHALLTEGALDKYKQWKHIGYISYPYLRKSWQKVLLNIFRKYFKEGLKVQNLVRELYQKYPNGFYVNAESRLINARGATRYIGRYLARPAMAEYRILEYDGKKVRFWYEDHNTKKRKELLLDVLDFIGRLIMHVPKKYFKMVRRYGLYSRGFNKKVKKIVSLWKYMKKRQLKLIVVEKKKRVMRWRENIIKSFDRDPLICRKCGSEMVLYEIWSPKHDFIYHFEHTDENGRHIKRYPWEEDPRIERRKRARQLGTTIPFPGPPRRMVCL